MGDFRGNMDKLSRRIHKLESFIHGSGRPLSAQPERAQNSNSRQLNVAMPQVRLGGDIGPSLMTARTGGETERDTARSAKEAAYHPVDTADSRIRDSAAELA